MEYLTTVELSEQWKIVPRRISVLWADGRIEGAIKKGKTWLIPVNAKKPSDKRLKKHTAKSEDSLSKMTSKETAT